MEAGNVLQLIKEHSMPKWIPTTTEASSFGRNRKTSESMERLKNTGKTNRQGEKLRVQRYQADK